MLQNHKILPDYSISIINPTLNFTGIQSIRPWLDTQTSYIMIPAISQQAYVDPWKIVLQLLPCSKNILIDICLPYEHQKPGGVRSFRHSARYFILNNKLLAIRVKSSQRWKKYYTEKIRVHQSIIRYYNQQGLGQNYHQCIVGYFYLTFRHFKLAPLFQSQLDTSLSVLDQFEKFGCQIYSIVDDVPKFKVGQISKISPLIFDRGKLTKCVYLYTGIKASFHPLSCYWTNAYILYDQILKKCSVNPFSNGARIKLNINLMNCRKHKIYPQIRFEQTNKVLIDSLNYREQYISFSINTRKNKKQNEELPNEKPTHQTLLMMYTWFLYNTINHRKPFTVGVPFTQKIGCFVKTVMEVLECMEKNGTTIQPSQIIILYKVNNEDKAVIEQIEQKDVWPRSLASICQNTHLYRSIDQVAQKNKGQVYIYLDSLNQMKQTQEKSQIYKNIKICHNLLPDQFLMNKIDQKYLRKDEVIKTNNKSLQKLCDQILNRKYETVENMARHFLRKNNNFQTLLQAFTQIIPQKLRLNFSLHPPYYYLSNATKQQIIQDMRQLEYNQLNYPHKDLIEDDKVQITEQRFDIDTQIRKTNHFKQNGSKNYQMCHKCQLILKKQLTIKCKKCQQTFCFDCLCRGNHITNKKSIQMSEFEKLFLQNCPVCKNICRCQQCSKNRQSIKNINAQQKNGTDDQPPRYQIKGCFTCQLNGRIRKSIDLECIHCKATQCVQCLKITNKISNNYFNQSYTCSKCSLNDILDSTHKKRTPKFSQNITLNENQTVQGIKRRAQEEQRQRKLQLQRQMQRSIEISNMRNKSPERSRRKKRRSASSSISNSSKSISRSFSSNSRKSNGDAEKRRQFQFQKDKDQNKIKNRGKFDWNNDRGRGRGKSRGRGKNWQDKKDYQGRKKNWGNNNLQQNNRDDFEYQKRGNYGQMGQVQQNRNSIESSPKRNSDNKQLWNSQMEDKDIDRQNNVGNLLFDTKNKSVIEEQFEY